METIEYLLPDWAAPYLFNDDCSHMSDEEIALVDTFVTAQGVRMVEMKEDSQFCTSNDLTKLGDNCSTFIAVKHTIKAS